MSRKFRKIPQPPIERLGRPSESRPAWIGVLILIVGGALVLSGLMTLHQVWGANAQAIPEWQLIQAVTRGGVHRADPAPLGQDGQATQPAGGGGVQKVQNPPDYCPT